MKVLKFLSFAVLAMCFAANLTASVGVIVLDEDGIVISKSSNGGDNDDILRQASPGDIVTVTIYNKRFINFG